MVSSKGSSRSWQKVLPCLFRTLFEPYLYTLEKKLTFQRALQCPLQFPLFLSTNYYLKLTVRLESSPMAMPFTPPSCCISWLVWLNPAAWFSVFHFSGDVKLLQIYARCLTKADQQWVAVDSPRALSARWWSPQWSYSFNNYKNIKHGLLSQFTY